MGGKIMVKAFASMLISLGIILGLSLFEMHYVGKTFKQFIDVLFILQDKAKDNVATYDDGLAVRELWNDKRRELHIWIPHTAIQEIDYQLDEAVGFLYLQDNEGALTKLELIIGMSQNVPRTYTFGIENIF